MERQKQKLEYPVLQKVLKAAPEEFHMLQAAYTPEELHKHEHRLANGSWNASFLPELVESAKRRLAERSSE